MSRRTNPQANRFYLEAKARFKPFAPGLLIRRQRHFDIFGPCLNDERDKNNDKANASEQRKGGGA